MEIRSSSCGWRRVQEAGARHGNSSKLQNRGGVWGSWMLPKQGKGERCPSTSISDFSSVFFASCWPIPVPNWVSGSFSVPDSVLVPQPDPASWPIKVVNSHPVPTQPFHVLLNRTYCLNQTTVEFGRTKLKPTLFLPPFCSVTFWVSFSFPRPHLLICGLSWLNYPLMTDRPLYKHQLRTTRSGFLGLCVEKDSEVCLGFGELAFSRAHKLVVLKLGVHLVT